MGIFVQVILQGTQTLNPLNYMSLACRGAPQHLYANTSLEVAVHSLYSLMQAVVMVMSHWMVLGSAQS